MLSYGFCFECEKDFTDGGFRIFFCSQTCWHKCMTSIRDGTYLVKQAKKNKEPLPEKGQLESGAIEPCFMYGEDFAECKELVTKDHVFNRHWCSYRCFMEDRTRKAQKIKDLKERAKAARERADVLKIAFDQADAEALRAEGMLQGETYSKQDMDKLYREINQNFFKSPEWRQLRYDAFEKYGRKCALCLRTEADSIKLHVDHIIPRSKRPDLALEITNLQILCEDCNMGKGNRYETDWRPTDVP